jgi:benzoyl-CoA 2,3-dioxygenase component A
MIHRQHRQRTTAAFGAGRMMVFSGARSTAELPYFGRLDRIPKDLVDVNLAFSRIPGKPGRYVQDVMRERSAGLRWQSIGPALESEGRFAPRDILKPMTTTDRKG